MDKSLSNDLVDNKIVRVWLTWGFLGAIFAPSIGIILSLKFNYPNFDSMVTMKPYWFMRTFTGITMDIGISLVGINLLLSKKAKA